MKNEEAIKILKDFEKILKDELKRVKNELNNELNELNPERPQGEWLWLGDNPNPNHKWSCNKCGRGIKEQENFCPNCGAKMKGGAE